MNNDTFQDLSAPKSDKKIWTIGLAFIGVALFLAVILPLLLIRTPDENTKIADAIVVDYQVDEDDLMAEIYVFQTPDGVTHEFISDIWSSEPSYAINDRVTVYYQSTDPEDTWVKDDENLGIMILVMQILGGVFGLIGLAITAMKMRNLDNQTINNVGGLIGALSFGIPSTFAFPLIAWIKSGDSIVNTATLASTSKISEGDFFIGLIFTILGIAVTVAAILMFRYQQKNGSNGIFMSFGK